MASSRKLPALLACFFLSGTAGLVYQTAWSQQFALVFGTTELAVATVLAAYMAGLSVGAAVAARQVGRVRRPIRVYALLELGIACAALLVPFALRLADRLQERLLGGADLSLDAVGTASALFYLVTAFAVLLVPTALMGATLPLLVRHAVHRQAEIGRRVGALYTANTIGAAAGTVLASFLLLPWLGLDRTVLAAVAINGLVFLLAAWLARGNARASPPQIQAQTETETEQTMPAAQRKEGLAARAWILPLVLISGFVSFAWEVVWTRLLSHLLGGSIYAFGTMLATFLTGLALGAALGARWARDPASARRAFAAAQLGIAASSFGAMLAIDRLPALMRDFPLTTAGFLPAGAPLAALLLLPTALFIGATFPLAVRILAAGADEAGSASGRVFAWNTLGAIIGALVTGFLLLPALKLSGMATLLVAISLATALATALATGLTTGLSTTAQPTTRGVPGRRWTLATVAVLGLIGLTIVAPKTPWEVLRTSPLNGRRTDGEIAFYGVGRSATVLLLEDGGSWRLTSNGLPESTIQPPGARISQFSAAHYLGLLPLVGTPDAKTIAIIGLGAGLTIQAVPDTVREIAVIELEPAVLRANRMQAAEREHDPLQDPRVRIYLNDARGALRLSGRRFDAIVSQPSHPWTAGASHLFTRELFVLARDHLSPGGSFVQWIGLSFVDRALLRSLLATLLDVFPQVDVFQPLQHGPYLFLARTRGAPIADTVARAFALAPASWAQVGVLSAEDLLIARVMDTAGARAVAADAALITDGRNLLQIHSPRITHSASMAQVTDLLDAIDDPLAAVAEDDRKLFFVRRLLRQRAPSRARKLASSIRDPAARDTADALIDLAQPRQDSSRWARAQRTLRRVATHAGGVSEAGYALLLLAGDKLDTHRALVPLIASLEADPAAAAVIAGRRGMSDRQPAALLALDPALAAIPATHALAQAATNLRIAWRLADGTPERAREALALLEPELVYGHQRGRRLLTRARLALAAEDRDKTLASLLEIEMISRKASKSAVRRQASTLLRRLPAAWRDRRYTQLALRLPAPL